MINLEVPKKLKPLITQAHQVGLGMFRPISRKYDTAEHEYPKELDMLGAILRGMGEGGGGAGVGSGQMTDKAKKKSDEPREKGNRNGGNMSTLLGTMELCWGDVGLAVDAAGSGPRQCGNRCGGHARADARASAASGPRWPSPSRTQAATRPPSATTARQGRRLSTC